MSRRVVITGIGVASPIGIGSATFWKNLIAGEVGVRRITQFDPSGFPSQIAGEVPAYKIGEHVPKSYRKGTKVMARDIELAVIAAEDAFNDAGLQTKAHTESPTIDLARFGCTIGAGIISVDLNELTAALSQSAIDGKFDIKKWGSEGMQKLTPLWLLKYLPNMLSCHVTIVHGLRGPSNTITCADASSHLAIGEAFRTIQRGGADLAICGGAETKIQPMGLMRQCLMKRVSTAHNEDPDQAVRPFDAAATGSCVGEGGGLFILESLEHAEKRGAKIYAELVGFGASQDVYKITAPDPSGHSYGKAITKALAEANLPPTAVNLVIPAGLGIPSHDRAELEGLHNVFGGGLDRVPLAPIKGQIGSLAAGSGVDAAAAVLALHHNTIPAAVNTTTVIDGKTLNVSTKPRDAKIDVAVSTVYSLGGQNAALVFKKL
ncbi:beta-ketoacyl-ACP synthase II [soil metagenome]